MIRNLIWIIAVGSLMGCERGVEYDTTKIPTSNALVGDIESESFSSGLSRKTYVPIYSNLHLQDEGLQVPLQAIVSLRNTDQTGRLKVAKVSYFNTNGDLVREYFKKPIVIKPLGSHEVFVRTGDLEGGPGAKFIVEWEVEGSTTNKPLIEAVFSGTRGSGAFSFSSRGVEIN